MVLDFIGYLKFKLIDETKDRAQKKAQLEYQRVIQENIRKLGKGASLDDLFKLKNKCKQLQKDDKN